MTVFARHSFNNQQTTYSFVKINTNNKFSDTSMLYTHAYNKKDCKFYWSKMMDDEKQNKKQAS